jgi:hypothetical protein
VRHKVAPLDLHRIVRMSLKRAPSFAAVFVTLSGTSIPGGAELHAQTPVIVETLSGELEGGSGGLTVAPDGSIYVADFGQMLNGSGTPGTRVYVVAPDGSSSVFAEGFEGASGNELGADGVLY